MKCLHLSDLHFGAHSKEMADSLKAWVRDRGVDVIICTGDLADDPDDGLLGEASDYLASLAKLCTDGGPLHPKLLLVPGNHDYRKKGFLWWGKYEPYFRIFGDHTKDHFFEDERVWIYTFDSSSRGKAGGSGLVGEDQIRAFHNRCAELKQNPSFVRALKIAAVHHHPLPVNWDHEFRDRWLTMTDAGSFLAALLFERVDLVLHGHEHKLCRSRLSSTLGENDHELTVVSLGASLKKVTNPEKNWLGLIHVDPEEVRIEFFGSVGKAFGPEPVGDAQIVRSRSRIRNDRFADWAQSAGYCYERICSVTELTRDGDARRRVELAGLRITDDKTSRRSGHAFQLPASHGYIDRFHCAGTDCSPVADPPPVPKIGKPQPIQLRFGTPVSSARMASYSYGWYSVNSFAMDSWEFDHMYQNELHRLAQIEFTHYIVEDPTEELAVALQFPDGFEWKTPPRIRVTEPNPETDPRTWAHLDREEEELLRNRALRTFDGLNLVVLQVPRPRHRMCYGIQWNVEPRSRRLPPDSVLRKLSGLKEKFRKVNSAQQKQVQELLALTIQAARDALMSSPWMGPLEASFLFVDAATKLSVLGAVLHDGVLSTPLVYDGISFEYGYGIAGRAFKTNVPRLYVATENSDEPDYYQTEKAGLAHKVLISLPVRPPDDSTEAPFDPYGVLSLGSSEAACPLATAGFGPNGERMEEFQREIDRRFFAELTRVFLEAV
jgi:3',5'-cyclic AMP phosphodiesterase CpdA